MKPGCRLLIVTGNGADLKREEYPGFLYLSDHLTFIGEGHIKEILNRSGFLLKQIKKYKRTTDNYIIGVLKNMARFVLGRKLVPLKEPGYSRFRSMWIRAELRD